MRVPHDPHADLDYTVDWSDWLATGETISTSEWIIPAGLTAGVDSHDSTTAWCWVSGGTPGTPGTEYQITNRIVTTAGRGDDRSITLICRER